MVSDSQRKREIKRLNDVIVDSGLSPKDVRHLVLAMKNYKSRQYATHKHDFAGKRIKVGVLGDTHFGNKWTDKAFLSGVVKEMKNEGVEAVYHCGDITDGPWQRHRNVLEQYAHGIENQVTDVVNDFPDTGLPIYLIDGNHDEWYTANGAGSPGRLIAQERDDMNYLGCSEAMVKFGKVEMMLSHPCDGSAYAYSYKGQKFIEALVKMQEKVPDVILQGHYHKMFYMSAAGTNYFCTGTTCLAPSCGIRTKEGIKRISKIKEGDLVLTHKRRWRKVTELLKYPAPKSMVKLTFGRLQSCGSRLMATKEHPVLVERNGKKQWVDIINVSIGDKVFVMNSSCKNCSRPIPYYNKFCRECNPMLLKENREKLSKIKGPKRREHKQEGSVWKHLKKDIIPFCDKLQERGWQAVPVGAGVIPDIVAFRNGKVKAFELESKHGLELDHKKKKYNDSPIMDYLHEVEWVDTNPLKGNSTQREFEFDEETGFIKVPVIKKEIVDYKQKAVYNLEIEEDHSYVASNTVVHNCRQTPWMRGKKVASDMGAWVLTLTKNKRGDLAKIEQSALLHSGEKHLQAIK